MVDFGAFYTENKFFQIIIDKAKYICIIEVV